jgi:membrane protein implicated in regulation of membrane protease activity
MTKKEDIDEKLGRWNEIFDELTLDAKSLIKDIRDMISYIAFCAMLMLMIGIAAIGIAILRQMEAKYIATSVIIFSIMAGNAYLLIRKWLDFRIRYNRLYSLQNKIESE